MKISLLFSSSLLTCIAYTISFPVDEPVVRKGLESERIINGKEAKPGQFPYVLRIAYFGSDTTCTGALITEQSALSAGHCVTTDEGELQSTDEFEGFLGSIEKQVDETKVTFREFRVHEDFNPNPLRNDVAILILREQVAFTNLISPVALPKAGMTYAGENVISVGWGLFQFGDEYASKVLRYLEGKVQSSEQCSEYSNDDEHVCVNYMEEDACVFEGDSGGPLIKEGSAIDVSIGIDSFGFGEKKCHDSYPEVYVSTSAYHDWIKQNAVGTITYA